MATMYPKNIELYKHTYSEKKVYDALQAQLPANYTVFFSVAWMDKVNGEKIQSECDFLIVNDQEGYLTCEVKGGYALVKKDDVFYLVDKKETRKLHRSPMAQSEESAWYFRDLYSKEYNEKFRGVYGSISLFPLYAVDDPVLMDHRDKTVVLDINDMNDLGKKIQRAFNFYRGNGRSRGSLTKSQRINFKDMINKRIASQASAGSLIEAKEYELKNVNRVQDNLVYFLKNYNRTFISGGAGTGKTWIAYKFAKKSSLEQKKTLFTTFNEQLIKMLSEQLQSYKNIDVMSFDSLLEKDGVKIPIASSQLIDIYDKIEFNKYDAIIVDEGQDFDQYQAAVISQHLASDDSELRVFYDLTQNIHDKDFKDGFDIKFPVFQLRENLRNTESIYVWATSHTKLGTDVITNQIIGPEPVSYVFKTDFDVMKYLESTIVDLVDNQKVPTTSIVILADHDMLGIVDGQPIGKWVGANKDDIQDGEIKVALVEDFKGLESNIIFYLRREDTPENYNYVAYTRAKYYLFEFVKK